MTNVRKVQYSFVGGEIDRRLWGRTDKPFYGSGAAKLQNVYVDPKGGVYRREGLKHVDVVDAESRILSFNYTCHISYLVLLTADTVRIYDDNDNLIHTETGVADITDARLPEMTSFQGLGRLTLLHAEFSPIEILVTANSPFAVTIKPLVFQNIPWGLKNTVATTTGDGPVKLDNLNKPVSTFDVQTPSTIVPVVGQVIASKSYGLLRVVTVDASTSSGTGVVEIPFEGTDANGSLTLPADQWEYQSGYVKILGVAEGYPTCGTFCQGRLALGGFPSVPDIIALSRINDYTDFNTGKGNSAEAIVTKIVDDEFVSVRHIFYSRHIVIFTCSGEYYVPQFEDKPITPSTFLVKKSTVHGSSFTQPVSIDGSVIFVDKYGKVVREILYNSEERSYNAESISILASHLVKNPIRTALRKSTEISPNDYVYYVNSDGSVSVLTMWRTQELVAWSSFETGGGLFLDACDADGRVYFIVRRGTNIYLERLHPDYILDGAVHGAPDSTFLPYANQTLSAFSVEPERFKLTDVTLDAAGKIVIPETGHTKVEIGYSVTVTIRVLPPEFDFGGFSTNGKKKRIISIAVQCYNTTVYNVVSLEGRVYEPRRTFDSTSILNTPLREQTGWDTIYVSTKFKEDVTLDISKVDPIKFYIISVQLSVKV